MNKTKILATLGTSSSTKKEIKELIQAGVNVFGFEFSTEKLENHKERFELVEELNHELNTFVSTFAYLTPDLKDLEYAVNAGFDYICVYAEDGRKLNEVRNQINNLGGKEIQLVGRLVNEESLMDIDDIIKFSDAIYFNAGKLAERLELVQLPLHQSIITEKCLLAGKPMIVGNSMLLSMTVTERPMKAEVYDVYNAIKEGVSAVSLNGETMMGKNPTNVVKTLLEIILASEEEVDYDLLSKNFYTGKSNEDAMAQSAAQTVNDYDVNVILADSKKIAKSLSKYHSYARLVTVVKSSKEAKSLGLNFGIIPVLSKDEAAELFITLGLNTADFVLEVTKNSTQLLQLK